MNVALWMLIGHALGDFYFQTNKMASEKKNYLVQHVVIYTLTTMVIYWLVIGSQDVILFGTLVLITHYCIDRINQFLSKGYPKKTLLIFLFDQICHIAILIGFLVKYHGLVLAKSQSNHVLLFGTIILYLIMPSSILIDKILCTVNKESLPSNFVLDEGTVIGILERMLILLMGLSGAISSVGFLITAKTMVRYGQFDDDNKKINFRSKYLIGTLSSVLIGFVLYACFEYLR